MRGYVSEILVLDGNSEHVAHVWRKKNILKIDFKFASAVDKKQMPTTDQATNFPLHVRTYF